VYVTTTTPPSDGIRAEITDWLVWPASRSQLRTKLRAWLLRRACRWQSAALQFACRMAERRRRDLREHDQRQRRRTRAVRREIAQRGDGCRAAANEDLVDEAEWFVTQVSAWWRRRATSRCAPRSRRRRVRDHRRCVTTASPTTPRREQRAASLLRRRAPHVVGRPRGRHLCIMDHRPRVLDDEQVERLRDLGRMVEAELE
jgi:hypothetical protein